MSLPGVGKNRSNSVFSLYILKLFPPPPPPLSALPKKITPPKNMTPPKKMTPPKNMTPPNNTTPPYNMPPFMNRLRLNCFEQKCVTTRGRKNPF